VALLTLSASHHDLDLDLLEQLSSGAGSVGTTVVADASVAGCVVLATCNRFELYLDVDDAEVAIKSVVQTVAEATELPGDTVGEALRPWLGARAVAQHLFGVAAGLESMVVGEREVAGQVRRALTAARADGTASPALERLFQTASRASRAVATGTGLGRGGRSVVTVALDLAAERMPLADATVLLIGTGSYARTALAALRNRGVGRVAVHSPSGRAAELADAEGLDVVPREALAAELGRADLVVGSSGANGPVVRAEDVLAARLHDGRPQVLVDLALRHDIDPTVRALGVPLIDLATVREHVAPLEVADARRLVAEHAERFEGTLAEQVLVPVVVALRGHVHGLLEEELLRSPTPEVERALRHFAARLLHTPVVRAREHARRGRSEAYLDAVQTLLGLDVEGREPE